MVRELGFAFTVNVVLHRANLDRIGEIIDLAADARCGPRRARQYPVLRLGSAEPRRLMPTRDQVERSREAAERAIERYRGQMQITYVLPDYYEAYPKACYGGWGKLYLVVDANGMVLPCHGATQITSWPSTTFESIRCSGSGRSLAPFRRSGVTLDERPLPELPPKGGRFRRLPLPGLRPDR